MSAVISASDHLGERAPQDGGWRELVRFARERSPFYRDLYRDAPAHPGALAEMPVVDLQSFWAVHRRPVSGVLTGPHHDGIVFATGGTTGEPKRTTYSREEFRATSTVSAACMTRAGLRAGDRVANLLYAGDLYMSFLYATHALRDSPLPVVELPVGGHIPDDRVAQIMEGDHATVAIGTASALASLAAHLSRHGRELPRVRLLLYGGEALHHDQRDLLARAFPRARPAPYAYVSVDAGILGTPDLDPGAGELVHYRPAEPHTILEIVDPDTGEPITEPGRTGAVLATSLLRRLMPVIRYPVGDQAQWTDKGCRRLRLLGRTIGHARVGTTTIDLDVLRSCINALSNNGGPVALQTVLRHRDTMDELVLRIVGSTPDPTAYHRALEAHLHTTHPSFDEEVTEGRLHRLVIEWVTPDQLDTHPRTGKALPLIDERHP
ncbi:phenylacetate--CoA ligase family protein [Streptomyces sp. NBC_01387]|uniref:phenylacetate--CoA ligase family protein n=1 Tax=Streptomyces sp. NBC_01387 TaxID=2903849 RepID=UPI003244DC8B